jgi:hypothetical protein
MKALEMLRLTTPITCYKHICILQHRPRFYKKIITTFDQATTYALDGGSMTIPSTFSSGTGSLLCFDSEIGFANWRWYLASSASVILPGLLTIISSPFELFGKAITSLTDSRPVMTATRRSNPIAKPACGGHPARRASKRWEKSFRRSSLI